ncbi:hypothetical protein CAJAP_07191 [Camponotus japonicus]
MNIEATSRNFSRRDAPRKGLASQPASQPATGRELRVGGIAICSISHSPFARNRRRGRRQRGRRVRAMTIQRDQER